MSVTKSRSLAKSLTWRVIAVVSTLLIGYAMTGSWAFAVSLTIVSNVINFVLYYIHERVWLGVRWGRS
jgi:adenylylsulfate kinase